MINIEILKKKRKEQKMTFDELSQKSGVPKRTLENIFLGKTPTPRIDTMQAIECALGLNDEWTAEERAAGVTDTVSIPITAKEDEIITLIRELTKKHGNNIQDVIITVLEKML